MHHPKFGPSDPKSGTPATDTARVGARSVDNIHPARDNRCHLAHPARPGLYRVHGTSPLGRSRTVVDGSGLQQGSPGRTGTVQRTMTRQDLLALPAVVDLATAAAVLG